MKNSAGFHKALPLLLMAGLLLAACGGGGAESTPTKSPEEIETEAVATFAAYITETAMAMPTDTATATASPSPTGSPTLSATNTAAPTAASGGADACYSMAYVSDVTIPDNTEVAPGQKLTKTWKVRNNGTCVWAAGFTFRFTGGESMGGSTLTLSQAVQAGSETNLSVELTAPNSTGSYRGNWRMATAGGDFFGDEVYILIVVDDAAATSTQSASATTGATATNTTAAATDTPTATLTPTATNEP
jgi:hypothetical protein